MEGHRDTVETSKQESTTLGRTYKSVRAVKVPSSQLGIVVPRGLLDRDLQVKAHNLELLPVLDARISPLHWLYAQNGCRPCRLQYRSCATTSIHVFKGLFRDWHLQDLELLESFQFGSNSVEIVVCHVHFRQSVCQSGQGLWHGPAESVVIQRPVNTRSRWKPWDAEVGQS